jgi:hypothetical protein
MPHRKCPFLFRKRVPETFRARTKAIVGAIAGDKREAPTSKTGGSSVFASIVLFAFGGSSPDFMPNPQNLANLRRSTQLVYTHQSDSTCQLC